MQEFNELFVEILDHKKDLRTYFNNVYDLFFYKNNALRDLRCKIEKKLIYSDDLQTYLQKEYKNTSYVILFYAHRPYLQHYQGKDFAHTSLLLCGVKQNKICIKQIINIDVYQFLHYLDILGERSTKARQEAQVQKAICQRIVISNKMNESLQKPDWQNMNCLIYAAAVCQAILSILIKDNALINTVLANCESNLKKPNMRVTQHYGLKASLISDDPMQLLVTKIITLLPQFFSNEGTILNPHNIMDYHLRIRQSLIENLNQHLKFFSEKLLQLPIIKPKEGSSNAKLVKALEEVRRAFQEDINNFKEQLGDTKQNADELRAKFLNLCELFINFSSLTNGLITIRWGATATIQEIDTFKQKVKAFDDSLVTSKQKVVVTIATFLSALVSGIGAGVAGFFAGTFIGGLLGAPTAVFSGPIGPVFTASMAGLSSAGFFSTIGATLGGEMGNHLAKIGIFKFGGHKLEGALHNFNRIIENQINKQRAQSPSLLPESVIQNLADFNYFDRCCVI
jgi:hypothetical protein